MTDDTHEAPERIFATGNATTGSWNAAPVTFRGPVEIEYVRADRIEELEGKLARLVRKIEGLEALRPVWAHGWTDDSVAAQTSSNALSQLWEMLGAKDQTQAVAALEELKGQE